jgi:hypothetical protein
MAQAYTAFVNRIRNAKTANSCTTPAPRRTTTRPAHATTSRSTSTSARATTKATNPSGSASRLVPEACPARVTTSISRCSISSPSSSPSLSQGTPLASTTKPRKNVKSRRLISTSAPMANSSSSTQPLSLPTESEPSDTQVPASEVYESKIWTFTWKDGLLAFGTDFVANSTGAAVVEKIPAHLPMRVGDLLESINGVQVSQWPLETTMEVLEKTPLPAVFEFRHLVKSIEPTRKTQLSATDVANLRARMRALAIGNRQGDAAAMSRYEAVLFELPILVNYKQHLKAQSTQHTFQSRLISRV